ncbi:hypothetical protein SAMN05421636_101438 [Pricia antarctica]|uniref:Uncharacterized protein n=1 Tax=Pricia antarctica TaxID=641691 RepID=A0A1G6WVD0_9FLAO|nr:hypothetical protein SAMN05421636_101438 [Pricia antarctica]
MLRLHKERSQNKTQENPVFQNAIGKLIAWASSSAPTIRYTYRQAKTIELHHYCTVLHWGPHIEIKAKKNRRCVSTRAIVLENLGQKWRG